MLEIVIWTLLALTALTVVAIGVMIFVFPDDARLRQPPPYQPPRALDRLLSRERPPGEL